MFALGLSGMHCWAQTTTTTKEVISSLEQKVVQAILNADTNSLKEVWAPEFLVNTPRNNLAKGRDAVFLNQRAGLINYSSFERIIEEVLVYENTVITMGYETFISKNDIPAAKAGQLVKRRFTNIWMKREGKWLQMARHASINCTP